VGDLTFESAATAKRRLLERGTFITATLGSHTLTSCIQDDLEYFDDPTIERMLEVVDNVDCVDETSLVNGPFSVFRALKDTIGTDVDAPSLEYDEEISRPSDVSAVYDSSTKHGTESPYFGLSPPLYKDTQAGLLMHHYANIITNLLQPIQHDSNIYRCVYVPNALAGSTELIMGISDQHSAPSSMAMFHALLSASAFHLRNNTTNEVGKSYNQIGLLHKAKAYQKLQTAVADPSRSDYETTQNAMLAMITIDVGVFVT